MPWTQRAFVMPIVYPNSPIYIGIFDDDPGELVNDVVGRIAIDTSKFYSDTEYILSYDLYSDPIVRAKQVRRLNIEFFFNICCCHFHFDSF